MKMASRLLPLLAAIGLPLFGCSAEPASTCDDVAVASEALMNGTGREQLGLNEADIRAIVLIESAASGGICSGALIAPNWVLTAGHCLALEHPFVSVSDRARAVRRSVGHDTEDAGLLELEGEEEPGASPPAPLRIHRGELDARFVGTLVELAGYGLTENGSVRTLNFLIEPVIEVTPTELRVDGAGKSGACAGDSGGPLLVRGEKGDAVVAGLLATGSASCLHEDTYLRTSALSTWILQHTNPESLRACLET
jgi:hypothetical protein